MTIHVKERASRAEAVSRFAPHQRIFLHPGDYAVVENAMVISTILGSCVAVCLYDRVARVAGMNHFLLPDKGLSQQEDLGHSTAGRYGTGAMELLINGLLKFGACKSRLTAKVFGGASLLPTAGRPKALGIGEVNSRFVHEFLAGEGIAVEAEDLGGYLGRVIHFHTDSFFVWNRKIKSDSAMRHVAREEDLVRRHINKLVGTEGEVTLF